VHRLHKVSREDVILPQKTMDLLDRNVGKFVSARDRIKSLGFSAKKGLLFYGPPGTGKTHTIHYLASQLPEHTTLLITAEQVAFIGEYFRLARFL
jgi:ATP-dependent 26S proteasome regulatory subunit